MIDINRHKFFLVQILKDVYSDIELANCLGFKGGTALMDKSRDFKPDI